MLRGYFIAIDNGFAPTSRSLNVGGANTPPHQSKFYDIILQV
jgi:hypothetical protein